MSIATDEPPGGLSLVVKAHAPMICVQVGWMLSSRGMYAWCRGKRDGTSGTEGRSGVAHVKYGGEERVELRIRAGAAYDANVGDGLGL